MLVSKDTCCLSFGSLLGKYFSLKQGWIYGNLSLSLNLLLFQSLFVMKLKRLGVKFGTVKLVSHNRHSCYSKVYANMHQNGEIAAQ